MLCCVAQSVSFSHVDREQCRARSTYAGFPVRLVLLCLTDAATHPLLHVLFALNMMTDLPPSCPPLMQDITGSYLQLDALVKQVQGILDDVMTTGKVRLLTRDSRRTSSHKSL